MKQTDLDKALIAALGGPSVLARRLGFREPGGVQRVHNWLTRGIPSDVRLKHLSLFRAAERKIATKRDAA